MTTKIQDQAGEFRKNCIEELDASCCIYMTRQSSKICANHLVTGWKLSKVIGKAFIPFASMTSGDQRRIVFRWQSSNAYDVHVIDYH